MPTQTLPARYYIYFSFSFPGGLLRRDIIKFYVESEFPIDTYVVDMQGFQDFQAARAFTNYGSLIGATEHRQEIRVPHQGPWYLIVNNTTDRPTAIHYEVY